MSDSLLDSAVLKCSRLVLQCLHSYVAVTLFMSVIHILAWDVCLIYSPGFSWRAWGATLGYV